jgi:hypothetical protein
MQVRVLLAGVLLSMIAACSSDPPPPPDYLLDDTVCSLIPDGDLFALTGLAEPRKTDRLDSPTAGIMSTPDPAAGRPGGSCQINKDGEAGIITLTADVAIEPSADTARQHYDKLRADDSAGVTVTDVKGLGTTAYLSSRRDPSVPWRADSFTQYKYVVQDGVLFLQFTFNGSADDPEAWPDTEERLQEQVVDVIRKTMKNLER